MPASSAAAEASLAAAKDALAAAEARYRAGQLTFAEVYAAREAFVRAETTRRRIAIDGALARARLLVWTREDNSGR